MSLVRPIARNLDESTRIVGLSPIELGSCAIFYSIFSPILKGVPLAPLISLAASGLLAITVMLFNRNFPPYHAFFLIFQWFRPSVVSVMQFDLGGEK
jgi:hypothetical protein